MRCSFFVALCALSGPSLFAQSENLHADPSVDWWKTPIQSESSSKEPPSLTQAAGDTPVSLTPTQGWFSSGKPRTPAQVPPVPQVGSNKVYRVSTSNPPAQAMPNQAGRGSVLLRPMPMNPPAGMAPSEGAASITGPEQSLSQAPSSLPVKTSIAPKASPMGSAQLNGPVSAESPWFPLAPSGPRPLLQFMQCSQVSPCLWSGYGAEQAAATAKRMRHVQGQCGCLNGGTQYFGNVLGGDCASRQGGRPFNRYASDCQSSDCALFGMGTGSCEGAGGGCASSNIAPSGPVYPTMAPSAMNPTGLQRTAHPSAPSYSGGKVASRPLYVNPAR